MKYQRIIFSENRMRKFVFFFTLHYVTFVLTHRIRSNSLYFLATFILPFFSTPKVKKMQKIRDIVSLYSKHLFALSFSSRKI